MNGVADSLDPDVVTETKENLRAAAKAIKHQEVSTELPGYDLVLTLNQSNADSPCT